VTAHLTGFWGGGADPAASWVVQVGGSTTSRETATATDALEIDMPPRHQRDARAEMGGGHGGHSAMDNQRRRNQVKFVLTMIQITR
jgi:hypothetical protein